MRDDVNALYWEIAPFEKRQHGSLDQQRRARTTQYDPRVPVQSGQEEIQNISPDILEKNIQISLLLGVFVESRALIIEGFIDTKLFFKPLALLIRTSNSNDLHPEDLTNLTDYRACRSCCTCYKERLAWFWLANLEQTLSILVSRRYGQIVGTYVRSRPSTLRIMLAL
jgi:hypothetical protein